MLFHHHFRDVWALLDDESRLAELAASIARGWNAEPRVPRSASRRTSQRRAAPRKDFESVAGYRRGRDR